MHTLYSAILLFLSVSSTISIYFTSCSESATRPCTYGTNVTDRLLSMKKGGSYVLSTNNYDTTFFPCQEYNYNCGYSERTTDFMTIANGVQLNLTFTQLLNIVPNDTQLTNRIKPYLGAQGSSVLCVGTVFPLSLADYESNEILTGYLNRLAVNLSALYTSNKAPFSKSWSSININIKTAVLQMAKYNMNKNFNGGTFWNNFLLNKWADMSSQLKQNYVDNNCPQCLHSAYLIDSVTTVCNKLQSINFLVDESGSIGASNFKYALQFLTIYVNQTLDDLSLMSINFYDTTFDPYINFGYTRSQILSMIAAKSYRSAGTKTGNGINQTVAKILTQNFPNGIPKLMVILTDGVSYDDVSYAAAYAKSKGITLFCVGIGANINNAQLLQIAGTQSNVLYIQNYASLSNLATLISNYFCKQIIDVNLNDVIIGNVVRVPTSPNYYRVARSPNPGQYYQLQLIYQNYIESMGEAVRESHYDPFPDDFSVYAQTQNYQIGSNMRMYYISPKSIQTIPLKKTLTVIQTPAYAFVSVAGTNMNFNITLTTCATLSCTSQKLQSIAQSKKYEETVTTVPYNDNGGNNVPNPSIFVAIGVGLGLMGGCTFGVIFGLRKFQEAPEEQPATANNLNQNLAGQGEPEAPPAEEVPAEENQQPPEEQN